MKKYGFWLKTEYKRAARMLPFCLLWTAVLLLLGGLVFWGLHVFWNRDGGMTLAKIGYTAEENTLTQLAVSYVEDMASVESLYELVPVTEEKGRRMVASGELSALLVLPENVVEEILYGRNTPATLYLPSESTPIGLLFEELAGAGIGMLGTAQAEIYAAHALAMGNEEALASLSACYDEIDGFNLRIVMNREQFFRRSTLSGTGGVGIAVYYGAALLALFLLSCGLFAGRYVKREATEVRMLAARGGIPVWSQVFGKTLVIATVLLLFAAVWTALCFLPGVRELLSPHCTAGGILAVVLSCLLAAVWIQLLYLLSGNRRTALLLVGITTIVQGYLAGCFIPTALLPEAAGKLAYICPAFWMKNGCFLLFSEGQGKYGSTLAGILVSLAVLSALCVLAARADAARESGRDAASAGRAGKVKYRTSLFVILGKRLLCQKSFWAVLALTVFVSVGISNLERQSETAVYAVVYDESGKWKELLSDYDGLVKFTFADSRKELEQNIMRGYAECGYVLQEDLQEKILAGEGSRSIPVYENADSTMTEVVNEVLFERLFYGISSEWFEGYIAGKEWDVPEQKVRAALANSLGDGSTFTFQKAYVQSGTGQVEEEKESSVFYPAEAVAIAGVLLCAVVGTANLLADRRAHRFYRQQAFLTGFITVIQPVLAGIITAVLLILT